MTEGAPYYSVKAYGRGAALCLCEALKRGSGEKTVNIEGALAIGRVFDWKNKIILQLSVTEMYQVLAVLEGHTGRIALSGHGSAHDKSLQLEAQPAAYFFKLIQRGRPVVAVPVTPADAIRFKSLLYRQIMANEAHLGIADIRALIGLPMK